MTERLALDDLDAHARAAWRIAGDICTCDADYHRVHPFLRAIGAMPGIAADRLTLNTMLPELIGPGSRILIAGAADATLLHYFVANSDARPLFISMVDRCPAPMALIDRMELPPGITVDTRQIDLTRLDDRARYDVILSHAMLPFVSDPVRLEILRRFGDSLVDDGRLIIQARIEPSVDALAGQNRAEAWHRRVQAKLPDFADLVAFCGDELPDALQRNAENVAARRNRFYDISEVLDLIERAGLRLVRHVPSGAGPAFIMPDGSERRSSGHIFVVARLS